jgi:hypothetical protein
VHLGERIGLIKFGSRMAVLFGPEWEVVVKPGTRVAAGSSVLARRREAVFNREVLASEQQQLAPGLEPQHA